MAYEVAGELYKTYETETKKNNFQVRFFVVKTTEQYPQFLKFQLTQDRCDLLNNLNEGQHIKVSFDLRGTERNGTFITNLNAWRIETSEQSAAQDKEFQPIHTDDDSFPTEPPPHDAFGDLPF